MRSARKFGVGALVAITCAIGATAAQASMVTVPFGDSVSVEGDDDADAIALSGNGDEITVVDTGVGGVTAGGGCTQINATTVSCAPAVGFKFQYYSVALRNGVDSFVNQNFAQQGGEISGDGATGVKTITGGPVPEFISGGDDSDTLSGGEGNDTFFDGSGDIAVGTAGNDTIAGGPGSDSVQYQRDSPAPLSLTLDGIANDGQAGEADNLLELENIFGGEGDDTIVGDASQNRLLGGLGADTIIGLGGNDELFGDFGSNGRNRGIVSTEPLEDTLDGGAGRDGLDCGPGFDLARHDDRDDVSPNCERTGAVLAGESAAVTGKRKTKVAVECPATEGVACVGRIELSVAGKTVGKGKFSITPDTSKRAKVKLTKKGAKVLRKAGGSLLVSVSLVTTEPGGETVVEGQILIYR
jgi:Ca2+-binding RTX toxin-like protein